MSVKHVVVCVGELQGGRNPLVKEARRRCGTGMADCKRKRETEAVGCCGGGRWKGFSATASSGVVWSNLEDNQKCRVLRKCMREEEEKKEKEVNDFAEAVESSLKKKMVD